eukprot:EG_transcript_1319
MAHTFVGFSLLEDRVYSGLRFTAAHDDQRLWLEEHVLGTLMPCLQELIRQVLAKEEEAQNPSAFPTPPLNPIDWLASLLMRHNPRHNAAATQHPYYRLLQDHVRRARAAPKAASAAESPPGPEEAATAEEPAEEPLPPETADWGQILPEGDEDEAPPGAGPGAESEAEAEPTEELVPAAEEPAADVGAGEDGPAAGAAEEEAPATADPPPEPEEAAAENVGEQGAGTADGEAEAVPEADMDGEETQHNEAEEPQPTWEEYHEARHEAQQADMQTLLDQLQDRAEAVTGPDDVAALFDWVTDHVATVLDGAVCYIARYDEATGTLAYRHASSTCSPGLASGAVTLSCADHPDAPSAQAVAGACCMYIAGVRDSPDVVALGDWPEPGDGDLFTGCVLGLAGTPVGLLSVDTLDNVAPDASLGRRPAGPRPISDAEQQFLQRVMELLGTACGAAAAAEAAAAVAGFGETRAHLGARPLCDHAITQLASVLSPTCNVYVSVVEGPPEAATLRVVAQLPAAADRGHSPLVGRTLVADRRPAGLGFALLASAEALYYVPDVAQEPAVAAYAAEGQPPPPVGDGCLCVAAIRDEAGRLVAVLGVEDGVDGLYEAHLSAITAVAGAMAEGLAAVARHRRVAEVAQQAVDWVASQTGLANVYVSLGDTSTGLRYVAASPAQAFLLGQALGPAQGLSGDLLRTGGAFHGAAAEEPRLHFWDDAQRGQPGDVLLVPLTAPGHPTAGVFGCDTLGTERRISPLEEACVAEVARYLAILLDEAQRGTALEDTLDEVHLAIEGVVGPERVRFLKRMWVEVRREIAALSKSDLQELAGYASPPAMVPTVLGAGLVLLGSKPSAVATWAACRPKVKPPLLGRIAKLDPTQGGRKAKFIRARRMLKGLTVGLVHDKGSRPTSLLYRWCSLAVQLRYTSDALRKQHAGQRDAALLLEGPVADAGDDSAEEEAEAQAEEDEVQAEEAEAKTEEEAEEAQAQAEEAEVEAAEVAGEAPEDTEEAAQSGTAAVEGEEEGQTAEEEAEAEAAAEELEQEEEQQEEEEAQGHEEGTEAQVPEGEQQEAAET